MDSVEKQVAAPVILESAFLDPKDDREVFKHDAEHQASVRSPAHDASLIRSSDQIPDAVMGNGGSNNDDRTLGVVGLVPGVIVCVFCGIFALYTAYLLVDFKLNHPEIHNMGDAGYILFAPIKLGWFGRELLGAGTLFFAITAVGGTALLGEFAIGTLDNFRLCNMAYCGIASAIMLLCSLPRALNWGLGWMSVIACISVFISCIVAMAGEGAAPTPGRTIVASRPQTFYTAFLTITNPVIAYAGHFMFFPLMSEMKHPQDAKKSATVLQVFATTFYTVFAVVGYCYLGADVQSPSFLSLSTLWSKIAWGIFLPNMIIAGALYNHTAAKIIFVRIFRNSHHLHSHTWLSWITWISLVVTMNGIGFVLALGVPFFSYLGGIAAALFASWYTYGLAGAFWWHDTHFFGHHKAWNGLGGDDRGWQAVKKHPIMLTIAILTLIAGAFICVAGMYAMLKSIVIAYATGEVVAPFSC